MITENVNYPTVHYPTDKPLNECGHILGIPDSLLDAAKTRLIQLLKEQFPDLEIGPADIVLENFQHVTWPDTSLGCPQEGHFYSQVLTPGYSIGFQYLGTTNCILHGHYDIHTNANGALIVSPDFPN